MTRPGWETLEGRLRWALKEREGRPSYEAVAKAVGTAKTRLSEWIGGTELTVPFLQKLPKALGVDPGWLLTGEGDPELRTPGEAERLLGEIRQLLSAPPKDHRREAADELQQRAAKKRGKAKGA